MEHTWVDADGIKRKVTPTRIYCYPTFGGQEVEIDLGLPTRETLEILRQAERAEMAEAELQRVVQQRGEIK